MKSTLLTLLLSATTCVASAQIDTVRLKRRPEDKRVIVTDRPPQAVYFQLGGSAPVLSANYDRRFAKKLNGAGFTAGLGFWGASGIAAVSVPVSLNYLFGRKSDFVEVAAGATYMTASIATDIFEEGNSSSIIYHANLGYRHQPATGGFFFRGGLSPLFFNGGYVTFYYIGFGYGF